MKYLITIVDLHNKKEEKHYRSVRHYHHDNSDGANETISKELEGWDNLCGASTSGTNVHADSYCQAGTTRDGAKMYSILCYQ